MRYFCTRKTGTKAAQPARFLRSRHSGCSSVRLEYASGGRGVAGSSPVTPTVRKSRDDFSSPSLLYAETELLATEERLITFLQTPATTRYEMLLRDAPELLQRLPLSSIASYLGITPVSLSRIRAHLK